MDRLRARFKGRCDDPVAAQIAFSRRIASDMDGSIRHLDMFRRPVRIGIDRNTGHPHCAGGLHDAAGNLASVRNQDPVKHCRSPCRLHPRPGSFGSDANKQDLVAPRRTDGK